MSEMEVSTGGMVLLRTIWKYPLHLQWKSNAKSTAEKSPPRGMCRQLSTAFKEMEVIDSIVENSKRSDLKQDYVQITETLLQKRKFLENGNSGKNVNLAKASNSSKVNVNVKPKTKRNASQLSSNVNDSGEFRTPSKKLITKANFTFNKEQASDDLATKIIFKHLALTQLPMKKRSRLYAKMPPIMVKPKGNLNDMLKVIDDQFNGDVFIKLAGEMLKINQAIK
ncbi:hypothetical protein CEXT_641281, partial [Caerostris extrusa]